VECGRSIARRPAFSGRVRSGNVTSGAVSVCAADNAVLHVPYGETVKGQRRGEYPIA
jgi:hypothetical protein